MNAAEAVSALREHAAGTSDASGSGFADATWRARHQGETLVLSESWTSLCEILQALADDARAWAQSGVPIEVAYAVSEILTNALHLAATEDEPAVKQSLVAFAWRVACGWDAVLAGDTEDVDEHVRNEADVRGIPALPGD